MTDDKNQHDPAQYFNVAEFVKTVIQDCGLGDTTGELRASLEEQIERRLAERVTATIINAFTPNDLAFYEKTVAENPDLTDMDALTIVAATLPGVQEKMLKGVQDLYEELTYDAEKVDQAVKQREESKNVRL